jgi:hypothetical protein
MVLALFSLSLCVVSGSLGELRRYDRTGGLGTGILNLEQLFVPRHFAHCGSDTGE